MPAQAHEPATSEHNIHGLPVLHASLRVRLDPSIRAEEVRIFAEDGCVAAERVVADGHFCAFRVVDALERIAAQRCGFGL